MIYIDSCIPMYLTGADHPLKHKVMDILPRLLHAHEELVTSVEVFQEIIHRYAAINRYDHLNVAYSALEDMVEQVIDVQKADVDQARNLAHQYKKLSARDCLHVALMKRVACAQIFTFDAAFDLVPGVSRIG